MLNYNLKKLQKIETRMLKMLADFCDENGIEYFIIGGTALGAVRHGGFIPWDDDIDVGMTRQNYNKFISLAKTKLKKPYFLQNTDTDPQSPFIFAKIRLDNSIFVEYPLRRLKMHHGVYIDIFPFDNIPDNADEYNKWLKKIRNVFRFYYYKAVPDYYVPPTTPVIKLKTIAWRILNPLLRLLPISKKAILKHLEGLITKYNSQNTSNIANVLFVGDCGKREIFFPLKEIQFEDIRVKCPCNLDAYLTNHYNNYVQLPRIEERITHNPYQVVLP